jgi:hypothetical protein
MWDETKSKFYKAGKPIAKCKDKECDGVLWAAKPAAAALVRQEIPNAPTAPDGTLGDLFTVYDVCFGHAVKVAEQAQKKYALGFTAEGVAAVAATLLIAAQKKGLV